MEITLELRSKADLAAESALSFPLTPMWLGIQHKIILCRSEKKRRISRISSTHVGV